MPTGPGSSSKPGSWVDHVGLEVEDLLDPPPAGDGVLALVDDLGRHQDGLDEQGDQEDEGDHGARGHRAAQAQPRPDHDDARGGDRREDLGARGEVRRQAAGAHRGPAVGLHGGVETVLGPCLDAVGAHHRRTDDGLGEHPQQLRDALADDEVGGGEPPLDPAPEHHEGHERQQHHDRQAPREQQHDARGDQQLPGSHEEVEPAELHEAAHRVDVGADPRRQRAALLSGLVEAREMVDVAEDPGAQVGQGGLDRRGHPGVHEPAGHHGHHDGHPGPDHDEHGGVHVDAGASGTEAVVGPVADRQGHDGTSQRGHRRQDEGQPQPVAQLGTHPQAADDGLPCTPWAGSSGSSWVAALTPPPPRPRPRRRP
jgi:hypothetical protein